MKQKHDDLSAARTGDTFQIILRIFSLRQQRKKK